MIDEIKEMILESCRGNDWKWNVHVKSVVKNAKILAKQLNADIEICEISAWLHDIYQVRECIKKDHHTKGAEEAVKILENYNYDPEKIKKIKKCILTHSEGSDELPDSLEGKIIRVADALSHFDQFLRLSYVAFTLKNMSFEEAKAWLIKKYANCWEKLELIPESKDIARNKYDAIKVILGEQN